MDTIPYWILRLFLIIGLLYVLSCLRWWAKEIPLKKGKQVPIPKPLSKEESLTTKIKQSSNSIILNIPKGFCSIHPEETKLVMKGKINECYSCLLKKP